MFSIILKFHNGAKIKIETDCVFSAYVKQQIIPHVIKAGESGILKALLTCLKQREQGYLKLSRGRVKAN